MNRRQFMIAMAAGGALPMIARAESAAPNLFDTVGPFPADRLKVYEFVLFTCGHCQQNHGGIASWGESLPKQIKFIPTPLAIDQNSFNAARAYEAVRQLAPDRAGHFMLAGFELAKTAGDDTAKFVNGDLAASVGIDRRAFADAMQRESVRKALLASIETMTRYRVQATPSLGIGGRWVIHPDHTSGDYRMLIQLANGLVSKALRGDAA